MIWYRIPGGAAVNADRVAVIRPAGLARVGSALNPTPGADTLVGVTIEMDLVGDSNDGFWTEFWTSPPMPGSFQQSRYVPAPEFEPLAAFYLEQAIAIIGDVLASRDGEVVDLREWWRPAGLIEHHPANIAEALAAHAEGRAPKFTPPENPHPPTVDEEPF